MHSNRKPQNPAPGESPCVVKPPNSEAKIDQFESKPEGPRDTHWGAAGVIINTKYPPQGGGYQRHTQHEQPAQPTLARMPAPITYGKERRQLQEEAESQVERIFTHASP